MLGAPGEVAGCAATPNVARQLRTSTLRRTAPTSRATEYTTMIEPASGITAYSSARGGRR